VITPILCRVNLRLIYSVVLLWRRMHPLQVFSPAMKQTDLMALHERQRSSVAKSTRGAGNYIKLFPMCPRPVCNLLP